MRWRKTKNTISLAITKYDDVKNSTISVKSSACRNWKGAPNQQLRTWKSVCVSSAKHLFRSLLLGCTISLPLKYCLHAVIYNRDTLQECIMCEEEEGSPTILCIAFYEEQSPANEQANSQNRNKMMLQMSSCVHMSSELEMFRHPSANNRLQHGQQ